MCGAAHTTAPSQAPPSAPRAPTEKGGLVTSPLNGKEWSKDGWGTHMKGQNSGHEVAVHPYELRERHLDHRLGATLEHARDSGLNP